MSGCAAESAQAARHGKTSALGHDTARSGAGAAPLGVLEIKGGRLEELQSLEAYAAQQQSANWWIDRRGDIAQEAFYELLAAELAG